MNTGRLGITKFRLAFQIVSDIIVSQSIQMHQLLDQWRYHDHRNADTDSNPTNG